MLINKLTYLFFCLSKIKHFLYQNFSFLNNTTTNTDTSKVAYAEFMYSYGFINDSCKCNIIDHS